MEKTAWIKIKKAAWPITAAVLAIALIGALAWGRSAANGRAATQANLEHLYQSAFDGLDNGLRTISTDLSKLRVATSSAQQTVLLSAVWREAAQVQEAAGLLPLNTRTSNALLRFINQTGDYCYMLCKRVQAGQGIGEEQYKTLLTLEEQSGAVADELDGMREENVDWAAFSAEAIEKAQSEAFDGFNKLSQSIEAYPTLIYDGPFSESEEKRTPVSSALEPVSYRAAQAAMEQLFPGVYTRKDDVDGQVPQYAMEAELESGQTLDLRVTKHGGLLYAILPRQATATDVIPEPAQVPALEKAALAFLEEAGFSNMSGVYAQFYAGAAVLNFAPVQNGVILYPDLVKVWVDSSTQQILGLEAHNYIVNHKERQLPSPATDLVSLSKRVSERLRIENTRLALIPCEDGQERLCYEFTGRNGEDTFSLYLDAKTGLEQNVLLIVDAEDGVFVY